MSKFFLFLKVTLLLPPVWLSNLGSDLLIGNIVQLYSADTRIASQDVANKVLELMEKWKYPNFRGKFCFLDIYWKHDTLLQSQSIHDSSVFCSALLSFFVLEIFGFSWTSLFIRYFGSISRFEQFAQPCPIFGFCDSFPFGLEESRDIKKCHKFLLTIFVCFWPSIMDLLTALKY